jgi:hypothetical protein
MEYADAVYHITSRGNEHKAVFRSDQSCANFLDTLQHVSKGCANEFILKEIHEWLHNKVFLVFDGFPENSAIRTQTVFISKRAFSKYESCVKGVSGRFSGIASDAAGKMHISYSGGGYAPNQ